MERHSWPSNGAQKVTDVPPDCVSVSVVFTPQLLLPSGTAPLERNQLTIPAIGSTNCTNLISVHGDCIELLHSSLRFNLIWFLHSDSPISLERTFALGL